MSYSALSVCLLNIHFGLNFIGIFLQVDIIVRYLYIMTKACLHLVTFCYHQPPGYAARRNKIFFFSSREPKNIFCDLNLEMAKNQCVSSQLMCMYVCISRYIKMSTSISQRGKAATYVI